MWPLAAEAASAESSGVELAAGTREETPDGAEEAPVHALSHFTLRGTCVTTPITKSELR